MAVIIPRWEWRTFGQRFGPADAAFAALAPTGVQESDEQYLLSGSGDNLKVRDDLMDLKRLEEIDADGLERWNPVMKAGFPLPAAEVGSVLRALGLDARSVERESYSLEAFVAAFAGPGGPLRPVRVHKRRVRYEVGGCTSEVSDVVAEGRTARTIAIESADKAAVLAAARSVGLGTFRNISYPKGLAMMVEDRVPRYAVIDAGTNSIKFHLAERDPGGGWRTIVDRAELTRLGEGLQENGQIGEAALERTATAIKAMADEALEKDAVAISAVGTAGLRIARNADTVLATIRERAGVAIEVIPGDEESRLAYLAVKTWLGLPVTSLVVFDTGGGSSQFTFGRGDEVEERFSVDVGAVRYTEAFGLDRAVSPEVVQAALVAIAADLSILDRRPTPDALVGMGGAITNMTAVKHEMATYDPDRVQGTVLDRAEVDRQIERYRGCDAEARRSIVGLQPKRAEVILAGACIVRTVMDRLGRDALTVSDRGLRHGVLVERYGG